MKTVNWGVLGASNFALNFMARAIHEAEGARLHSLATAVAAKAEPFRAFCPDLAVHGSYEALLADPAVDAVYIPLPNHLHVEWTQKALEAGKHVLCEKPIAMKAAEIDAIIALRDRTGLLAAEAYMIVHHPNWQKVRDLVRGGAIGAVRHVDAHFTYDLRDMGNVRNRPETGGGSLPDIGVYTFGSVRWVTGAEPARLAARIERENDVDTFALVHGDMTGPGGSFTYHSLTSMRLFGRQEVVFHGETGLIRVLGPFNAGVFHEAQTILCRPGFEDQVFRFPGVRQYRNQVEAFSRAVRGGPAFAWTLEDARGTQAMIDMAFAAARPL
ncbi:MAG: Gfo/Idh/MocA family oxidoreductase [Rhodobacteraceae bacterium]|nr:Gfo/Idh/MocA family oxidoreductase [Paracoccaceae bacterium]